MGVLFMNPTRRSAMLWTITPEDYETFTTTSASILDEDENGWSPKCKLLHEFSVAPLQADDPTTFTQVSTMDEAIQVLGVLHCLISVRILNYRQLHSHADRD
jgi:hypothetical protein